ncbi:MAG: pitrilysin family protein [Chitinophagales bacterium]|nr:pitrilysin family protein [Chitinophagales bacterium]
MQRTTELRKLDRKAVPPLQFIKGLHVEAPQKTVFPNGLPLYAFGGLQLDAIKVEFVFKAGKWYENKKLIAKSTSRMMKEGSEKWNALQIAEELDYYGASIKTFSGSDTATLTFFSLNKYFDKILPIMEEVIKRPAFPQNDLNIYLANNKDQLLQNQAKNEYRADRQFNFNLYGERHPYGYFSLPEDFEYVSREELAGFHKRFYNSNNCTIIVSGNVTDQAVQMLENFFGGDDWKGTEAPFIRHEKLTNIELKHHEKLKDKFQSAIRIGKLFYNKSHPDFHKFSVLNTILGGYFGSRLMTNLREEKGYTYGVYSSLTSMINGGYFIVGAEVGIDVCADAIKEIYGEINRLREELVPEEELGLVRNYLMGRLQSSLDGPFKVSGVFKGLLIYDLDISYIYQLIETIQSVSAQELRDLAIDYFDPAEMHEIVVG